MAFDLFRRKQVPGNWALASLTSTTPRNNMPESAMLAPTPNLELEYLKLATDQAKTTDLAVSKSGIKVAKKFAF